jgi:hypothetical protein
MRALPLALAALAGCAHVDHRAMAQDIYARAVTAVGRHQYSRALGLLFGLRSPQLWPYRPRGADALEKSLQPDCSGHRMIHPTTMVIEEPPVVDEWYVWRFDGTWWDDELDGFVLRYSSACSTID